MTHLGSESVAERHFVAVITRHPISEHIQPIADTAAPGFTPRREVLPIPAIRLGWGVSTHDTTPRPNSFASSSEFICSTSTEKRTTRENVRR